MNMLKPDFETVKSLSEQYNTIPVSKEFYADVVTPITLLRRISGISNRYFLLESVENGTKWGRYSFLGFDPIMHIVCKNQKLTVEKDGKTETVTTAKPFDVVRDILKDYHSPKCPDDSPFTGGFVGYFSYSMIGYAEPKLKISSGDFNDLDLMLFEKVIAYDHLKQKINITVNIKNDNIETNYHLAEDIINRIAKLINSEEPLPKTEKPEYSEFKCNFSKEEYCGVIERTKEYIRDGDIFQAVISRRFEADFKGSLIIVTHDRHFLDRLVDHLFVFCGDGVIKDFIGGYSAYRTFISDLRKEEKARANASAPKAPVREKPAAPRKLSWKEKKEMEQLEADLEALGAEQKELEAILAGGTPDYQKIAQASERYEQIRAQIDAKETRWLELSEI